MRVLAAVASFLLATAAYDLGGRQASWTHLFYIPILVGAAGLGYPGAFLAVLASGLVIGLLFPPASEVGAVDAATMWATRLVFYFLVGGTSAVMFQTARNAYLRVRELNLGLEEERDRSVLRVRGLESIRELDRIIMGEGELEHMLMVILQALGSLRGAAVANFWRLDSERGLLFPEASVGVPIKELRENWTKIGGMRLGEGATGWAVLQMAIVTVRDIKEDPRYTARIRDVALGLGEYQARMAAPVAVGGRVYGALSVGFREPRDFTEEDTRIVEMLANQMAVGLQSMEQRRHLRELTTQAIAALGEAIEARDPYTGGHCSRLADYSAVVAQEMGLSREVQERIRYAAYLHDVGKVGVSDAVLKKAGPLTPQEYAEIKQHPYIGSQLIKRMPMLSEVAPIVYHHHERYDGRGYPDGVSGERIPIEARIIGVVDAFDAMTHDRPYRTAIDIEVTRRELTEGKGTQFDPTVVDAFFRVMERGSVGSGGGTPPLI